MSRPMESAPRSILPEHDHAALGDAFLSFGLGLVVLYGSWARRAPPPGPESDIDLAVLGCATEDASRLHAALGGIFPTAPVDLVRLEDADPLFRYEVMECGVLLAGDPDRFCEYRAYAYRDFTDSADLRALEAELHRKKMALIAERIHAAT